MNSELIRDLIRKPIRSEEEYEQAIEALDELFGAKPGTEENDQLGVLIALVQAYEREHYPVSLPDPISAIQFYMETHGLTRKDLEETINCADGRVSEILNKKRCLTISMIRKLHNRWGISADTLIQEYAIDDDLEETDRQVAVPYRRKFTATIGQTSADRQSTVSETQTLVLMEK